jgi:hypothetical protein
MKVTGGLYDPCSRPGYLPSTPDAGAVT